MGDLKDAIPLCRAWVPVCPCRKHGWVARLVCDRPKYHRGPHQNARLQQEWDSMTQPAPMLVLPGSAP